MYLKVVRDLPPWYFKFPPLSGELMRFNLVRGFNRIMFFLILVNHQSKYICFVTFWCTNRCIKNDFKSFQCILIIWFWFYRFYIHILILICLHSENPLSPLGILLNVVSGTSNKITNIHLLCSFFCYHQKKEPKKSHRCMKFSKNLRHSLNCGNSSPDLRYHSDRDPQTPRSFLRSLLDFLNANFMRRYFYFFYAFGFSAGHPLGEDSVKSQTEKWVPVKEIKSY